MSGSAPAAKTRSRHYTTVGHAMTHPTNNHVRMPNLLRSRPGYF